MNKQKLVDILRTYVGYINHHINMIEGVKILTDFEIALNVDETVQDLQKEINKIFKEE